MAILYTILFYGGLHSALRTAVSALRYVVGSLLLVTYGVPTTWKLTT